MNSTRGGAGGLTPLEHLLPSSPYAGVEGLRLLGAARAGLPVGPTWVVEATEGRDFFRAHLPPGHDPAALLKLRVPVRLERAARAYQRLREATLPSALVEAAEAFWRHAAIYYPAGLRVRTSPLVEDETLALEAHLTCEWEHVADPHALLEAVRDAWALLYNPEGLTYLAERGVRDATMAVLVQPVAACFCRSVLAEFGRSSHDAGASPWTWSACNPTGSRTLGDELTEEQTASLRQLLDRVDQETRFERGQAELGLDAQHRWHIVRLRGLLGRGFPVGGNRETVWALMPEQTPSSRMTTPLTQSVLRPLAEAGLRGSLAAMGASPSRSERFTAQVRGRLYARVSGLLRNLSAVSDVDAGVFLEHQGVEARAAKYVAKRRQSRRRVIKSLSFLRRWRRLAAAVPREIEDFGRELREAQQAFGELDLAILPDDGLVPTLRHVRSLVDRAMVLNARACTATYGGVSWLRRLLQPFFGDTAPRLVRALVTGLSDFFPLRLVTAFSRLVAIARQDAAATRLLRETNVVTPAELPDGPLRYALSTFLGEFGDCGPWGMELSTARWNEVPTPVVTMLRACLRHEPSPLSAVLARARSQADLDVALLDGRLLLPRRLLLRKVARQTKVLLARWSQAHFLLLQAYAMLRRVALEADRRMQRVERHVPSEAVFLCPYDMLLRALTTGRPELGNFVALSAFAYGYAQREPRPPSLFVGLSTLPLQPAPAGRLQGLPVGGGKARGRPLVVSELTPDVANLVAGDILVCASFDVSLAPLLLVAAGLVLEDSTPMSMGVLLARELGLPTVVQAEGAATLLAPATVVAIDGTTGQITWEPAT